MYFVVYSGAVTSRYLFGMCCARDNAALMSLHHKICCISVDPIFAFDDHYLYTVWVKVVERGSTCTQK